VQCTIIRTTELATAEDRLADLERQKDEIMRSYSPAALLAKLQSKYSRQLHLQFLCSLRCIFSSEAAHFVACIEIGYDMLHNYISTPHSHLLPISDFLAMHAPHMCTGQVAVIQLRA
jgi:hypothetical protein